MAFCALSDMSSLCVGICRCAVVGEEEIEKERERERERGRKRERERGRLTDRKTEIEGHHLRNFFWRACSRMAASCSSRHSVFLYRSVDGCRTYKTQVNIRRTHTRVYTYPPTPRQDASTCRRKLVHISITYRWAHMSLRIQTHHTHDRRNLHSEKHVATREIDRDQRKTNSIKVSALTTGSRSSMKTMCA